MSRSSSDEFEEQFPNEGAFWERRVDQVLNGRRGRKALAELREALLALPEKRLIADALCTVGKTAPHEDKWGEYRDLFERQGVGVCAVGAYAWYKRVQAGMDPDQAFASLPLNADFEGDPEVTVGVGTEAGLVQTLAWVLMGRNDEHFENMTPEGRYEAFLKWIDGVIGAPELVSP